MFQLFFTCLKFISLHSKICFSLRFGFCSIIWMCLMFKFINFSHANPTQNVHRTRNCYSNTSIKAEIRCYLTIETTKENDYLESFWSFLTNFVYYLLHSIKILKWILENYAKNILKYNFISFSILRSSVLLM